jgi:hypothetical protein
MFLCFWECSTQGWDFVGSGTKIRIYAKEPLGIFFFRLCLLYFLSPLQYANRQIQIRDNDAKINADANSDANAPHGQPSVTVEWCPIVVVASPAHSCGNNCCVGWSQHCHCFQEVCQKEAQEEGWCCVLLLLLLLGGRVSLTSWIPPRLSPSRIQPTTMMAMASRGQCRNPSSVPEGTVLLLLLPMRCSLGCHCCHCWLNALPPPQPGPRCIPCLRSRTLPIHIKATRAMDKAEEFMLMQLVLPPPAMEKG